MRCGKENRKEDRKHSKNNRASFTVLFKNTISIQSSGDSFCLYLKTSD